MTGEASAGLIPVYGYIGDAAPPSAAMIDAIRNAHLVVGGRRHLDAFDVPAERRVVLGPLDPAIDALQRREPGTRAVVVASGDPGFFGIVRRLKGAGLDLVVEPCPSACALAFGRAGVPWEDGQVVSAHGRDLRRAVNVIRAHPLVAVMTDVGTGLREIAAALGPWPRALVLVEHLGEADERVRRFGLDEALALDPADIHEPNAVVAIAADDDPARTAWTGPGMPWRLGDRGRLRCAAELRSDAVSALVMGAFGAGPGDLVAVLGEGTDLPARGTRGQSLVGEQFELHTLVRVWNFVHCSEASCLKRFDITRSTVPLRLLCYTSTLGVCVPNVELGLAWYDVVWYQGRHRAGADICLANLYCSQSSCVLEALDCQ